MRFGLRYCNTGPYVEAETAIELAQAAESVGFESLWTVEHTVVPANYKSPYPYSESGKMAGGKDDFPIPDPLIWMTYVAAATSKIKLATGILILPQHNPVVVAKQVATLDLMSNGRTILGVGVGWLEEEFAALGIPFVDRGSRTDEYILALRSLWSEKVSSFKGRFVNFDSIYCRPLPKQSHVPIIIGGHSKAAARRAGRLADGYFPARSAPVDLIREARQSAEESGRDPDALEITTGIPENLYDLEKYAQLGVSRVLLPVTSVTGLDSGISNVDDVIAWKDKIEKYKNL